MYIIYNWSVREMYNTFNLDLLQKSFETSEFSFTKQKSIKPLTLTNCLETNLGGGKACCYS